MNNAKTERVELSCRGEQQTAFELAILKLGYKILDSYWEDETDTMFYVVVKKWIKL